MTDETTTPTAPESADVAEPEAAVDTAPQVESQAPAPSPIAQAASTAPSLGKLADVTLDVSVELGRSRLPIRELLSLDEGGVIRLEHPVGDPVDLLVNGLRTARGEIVVVDGRIGLRVTELVE